MQVRDFINKYLQMSDEDFKKEGKTEDGFKFMIDGKSLGLSSDMPECSHSLMRLGRHIYIVDEQNSEYSVTQLTIAGT